MSRASLAKRAMPQSKDRMLQRQYADVLAEFVSEFSLAQMPAHEIEHALRVIRDTLGTIIAGATLPEIKAMAAFVPMVGGDGACTLVGRQATSAAHAAAMVNSAAGVSLELDEG